jgi:hypothetical protein
MTALPYFPKPQDLAMPLTNVDQSGYSWFKFSHIEFLLDPRISTLKLAEQGALIRLIAHAARQTPFASLSNEPELLAAMVGLSLPRWAKMADQVLGAAFVLCADGRLYCPLMVDELASPQADIDQPKPTKANKTVSKEVSDARRVAAAKSHAARKAKLQNDDANLQTDHANLQNDSILQNLQHAKIANGLQNGGIKGGDLDLEKDLDLNKDQSVKSICAASQHTKDAIAKKFDVFWAAYPKKTDRKKACIAFARIKPSDDLLQTMLSAISAWSSKWTAEPQYIPHPTTWLNGERWNDAPPATPAPQSNHHKPLNAHSEIRQNRAELMRQSLDRPFAAEVNQP